MNHLCEIQSWLRSFGLAGFVVPSTDEFLSEFPPPSNRRLFWATGFRGSTGLAIVLPNRAALFVDGRYLLQAAAEVDGTAIDIESGSVESRRNWLRRELPPGGCLALDPSLHSSPDISLWQSLAADLSIGVEMLTQNPIDELWLLNRPPEHKPTIVEYPRRYAGEAYEDKCARVSEHVKAAGLQALLVSDPEDVSWLLNVRAYDEAIKTDVGDWHIVPSCTSRALVQRDCSVTWFVDRDRLSTEVVARGGQIVAIASPDALAAALKDAVRHGPVGADLRRTPASLTGIIEARGQVRDDDTVARWRWHKHVSELDSARRVHIIDAVAVVRFLAWLTSTVREQSLSEFEAAQVMEAFRAQHPDYKGASSPLMFASGRSGAQPHYIPRLDSSRRINDHPIFWMDSGGQYFGGTTDNTVAFALGVPEAKHVLAHTLVLQGFIALASARVPVGIAALRLDTIARQPLWGEGMDYPHSTGHGVGNYLNIHEGPHIGREPGAFTLAPIDAGIIVTNEPGYYADGDFGVRIESHMVVVESSRAHFVEFEIISRLPIDPHLVSFERLSPSERRWLVDYHETIFRDLEPLLDESSLAWLRAVVDAFARAEMSNMDDRPISI